MIRRTLRRVKIVLWDNFISLPLTFVFLAVTLYLSSYVLQCLIVDVPIRTIHLEAPSDAEVRAESSITANAFQVNVDAAEWQSLYNSRQEGSHPIMVIRHNGIESWLPRFGGVLHHSLIEKPIFAGTRVEWFWRVGTVEKASENMYRVTASKERSVPILAGFLAFVFGLLTLAMCADHRYGWSRSWNRSLHHVS